MNHLIETNAPRVPQAPWLRNDARSLLRSRPVQAILLAGTVLQVAVIAKRDPEVQQTAVRAEAPIRVIPAAPRLQQVAELALADSATAESAAAVETDRADELARKYRKQGYKVSDRLAGQIHEAAVEHGIDPAIAFGLVRTESGFRNSATSHVGATGLTQLMPATARWLKPGTTRAQLRDPETNLAIGFRYLRQLIRKYDGDTTLALLAYNRGPGTVDRVLRRGGDPDNGYADMVRGLRTTHR